MSAQYPYMGSPELREWALLDNDERTVWTRITGMGRHAAEGFPSVINRVLRDLPDNGEPVFVNLRPKDNPTEIMEYIKQIKNHPSVRRNIYWLKTADIGATAKQWLLQKEKIAKNTIPAEELVRQLKNPEADARATVCWELVRNENIPDSAVDSLTALLNDTSDDVRMAACAALGQIGPSAASAAEQLVMLADKDDHVLIQRHAIVALGKLGLKSDTITEWLIAKLADKELGRSASTALFGIVETLRPSIMKIVDSGNAEAAFNAALVLEALGEKSEPAIPAMVAAFSKNDDAQLRLVLIRIFKKHKTKAQSAVPALLNVVKNYKKVDSFLAVESIRTLRVVVDQPSEDLIRVFTSILRDIQPKNRQYRIELDKALAKMGPSAASAVPALLENILPCRNNWGSFWAIHALEKIIPNDSRLINVCRRFLKEGKGDAGINKCRDILKGHNPTASVDEN